MGSSAMDVSSEWRRVTKMMQLMTTKRAVLKYATAGKAIIAEGYEKVCRNPRFLDMGLSDKILCSTVYMGRRSR